MVWISKWAAVWKTSSFKKTFYLYRGGGGGGQQTNVKAPLPTPTEKLNFSPFYCYNHLPIISEGG